MYSNQSYYVWSWKTLQLPFLRTNEVYYSKQLSPYNLGIHYFPKDQESMHLWTESEGKMFRRCILMLESFLLRILMSMWKLSLDFRTLAMAKTGTIMMVGTWCLQLTLWKMSSTLKSITWSLVIRSYQMIRNFPMQVMPWNMIAIYIPLITTLHLLRNVKRKSYWKLSKLGDNP